MSGVRFLDIVKPFAPFLPEVTAPHRKIAFHQRILWTVVVLLIFLVMSEIPLYGIVSSDTSDPFMWLRTMLASNRGTLMELGITPIVSSSMVFQFLTAAGFVEVNSDDRGDRELLEAGQKLLTIILSFGQAFVYVFTGMYGSPSSLGLGVCFMLIVQLVFAALIVLLLDELLQKGYGLGSGTSLFVATNTCEQVVWKTLSPNTTTSARGKEVEGALYSLVYLLSARRDKKRALLEAFTRTSQPNMSQFVVTVALFLVVVYAQTLQIELPVRSTTNRGSVGTYPIRLFYTSNMPIMLQSALSSNIVLISQMMFSRFPDSVATKLLGQWEANQTPGHTGQLRAVSGLVYYIQQPQSWHEVTKDPLKAVIYLTFVVGACAVFSKLWLEVSRTGPRETARKFREQGLVIMGAREQSTYRELKRIIPTAAWLGGAAIGLLSVLSDLLGTLGSGTGILLAVTTIYGYVEAATKEGGLKL